MSRHRWKILAALTLLPLQAASAAFTTDGQPYETPIRAADPGYAATADALSQLRHAATPYIWGIVVVLLLAAFYGPNRGKVHRALYAGLIGVLTGVLRVGRRVKVVVEKVRQDVSNRAAGR